MSQGVRISDAIRAHALALVRAGATIADAARAVGYAAQTVRHWILSDPELSELVRNRGRARDLGALIEQNFRELQLLRRWDGADAVPPGKAGGRGDSREAGAAPAAFVTFADLKIQTIDQELLPFEPNEVQTGYLDAFWPHWRDDIACGRPMPRRLREIILKARRFGFTTLIAALFFCDTLNRPNTTTVQVAQELDTAEEIFEIVHRFWENLPEEKRAAVGMPKRKSRHSLVWDKIDSRYMVRSANASGGTGRGMTIHNLHCSEAAYYRDRRIYRALLQAVSKTAGNVFIESTANGESGDGEQYCKIYREAAGVAPRVRGVEQRSEFQARFFPWWSFTAYEAIPAPGFMRTSDEVTLANRHGLDGRFGMARTNAKLQWRRQTMAEPDMGPGVFPQEYPGDPTEAFLVSGTRYFTGWDPSRHVISGRDVPAEALTNSYWPAIGGYDWGYKPGYACFLLARVDDWGGVIITDEIYQQEKTDAEQARAVLELLKARGLNPQAVPIYADPNMWAQKTDFAGRKTANVLAFQYAGLRMYRASGDGGHRLHRWQNLRRYLHEEYEPRVRRPGGGGMIGFSDTISLGKPVPFLRIVEGRCPNLIRTLPLMLHDRTHPEDLDSSLEDHAVDTLGMLLDSRPRGAEAPPVVRGPGDPPGPGMPDLRPDWVRRRDAEIRAASAELRRRRGGEGDGTCGGKYL